MASRRYSPLLNLVLSRLRLFLREPAAIFWVYGFPILMMLSLGVAFREDPIEQIAVDLVEEGSGFRVQGSGGGASSETLSLLQEKLAADPRFIIIVSPPEDWQKRLQAGKTDLVIEVQPGGVPPYRFWDEPRRAESRLARYAVEALLLRGETPAMPAADVRHLDKPGSRYIDFLLPGMIGMGLMGGGMWGVGFVIVDMRVRKLLKRFLATPMRRSHFMLAVMLSRLLFTLADVVILLAFGYLAFGVKSQGNYLELTLAVLLGGASFAGVGLLVASRAQTIETASGLMNLVMLPMWILSGVFFSSERFPEAVQPFINLLPLTALNQLLRGIMLEGQSLAGLWPQVAILAAYGTLTFAIALRVFRWK
jgi:ABC-type multidrug transport system permease subunit